MSLFSAMMASVSGMQGQATLLSTISDNISNSSTTGYKEADASFEDMLSQVSTTSYTAGGVGTRISYGISTQGDLESATESTDLGISGNGFFVVQDASGNTFLTRAGDFSPNVNGNLVNSEGYMLMGYPDANGTAALPGSVGQLTPITITTAGLSATPSTTGTLTANLDSAAAVVAPANLPSAGGTSFTSSTTVTAYDDLGTPVTLNVYFTNMGVDPGTGNDEWEVDVYNNATPSTATPANTLLSSDLEFSPSTGDLATGSPLAIAIPGGQTLSLNVSSMTQLDSSFGVTANTVNGNAPASYSGLSIGTDGTVSEIFSNGTTTPIAKIPLATVASVNSLTPHAGQTYSANPESGNIILGNANSAGFGSINSNELESSTVDLATQLTNMVVAQNAYSANSKAFQTGSDMLTTLINMLK
jgi:flagellar hook protein FlgE